MLHHDGYELADKNQKKYRYIGTIDITNRDVRWTAVIYFNDVPKGTIKGTLTGVGDDEGPVRRAVDIAVKEAIQSLVNISD
jgi:hypothetical protein